MSAAHELDSSIGFDGHVVPAPVPPAAAAIDIDEQVARLAAAWRSTAVERDRAGGHAAHERELVRASGLLALAIPRAFGGLGESWVRFYDSLRVLAREDSALAHLYAFHHLQVATVLLYGDPRQQSRLLAQTIARGHFWGNALNPNDRRALAVATDAGGYVVDGPKSFCSGSVGSDMLTLTAWHEPSAAFVIGVVSSHAPGVRIEEDWDAFGQKQTDSGTVHFERVALAHEDVLVEPGAQATVRATLRAQFAQLILAHLYLGIAEGALDEGRRLACNLARPWFASGVSRTVDDPYVQERMGELHLLVRPARVLCELAARRLDEAFVRGDTVTPAQRGEVAIAVAEAKVTAHRAALEVSSRLFEVTGARSTSGRYGLDRFWRNARVHTLHDPVDYKIRDLGRHVLEGRYPEPTSYS